MRTRRASSGLPWPSTEQALSPARWRTRAPVAASPQRKAAEHGKGRSCECGAATPFDQFSEHHSNILVNASERVFAVIVLKPAEYSSVLAFQQLYFSYLGGF